MKGGRPPTINIVGSRFTCPTYLLSGSVSRGQAPHHQYSRVEIHLPHIPPVWVSRCFKSTGIYNSYSSPMASLVLTDSSQLTSDSQHLAEEQGKGGGSERLAAPPSLPDTPTGTPRRHEFLIKKLNKDVYPHLRGKADQDSNPDLPVIGSLVYCESSAHGRGINGDARVRLFQGMSSLYERRKEASY
uniref:Uncharacterized protein n=1 Tax=Timema monikensis TaxID=170555 RepID=A0A7R9DXS6_9NEOP|nr:unnamed protein product [Timema monikensis]